jgi:hypothetical protein
MRASFRTYLAATALASLAVFGCNERQRDPDDHSSMAAGAPAVRAVSTVPAEPASGLAGRTYVVEVRERGGDESRIDTLTFADGRLRSSDGDRRGFDAAEYRGVNENIGESFTAVAASQTDGQIEWSGLLAKGRLDGRFVWKKSGQAVEYEFSGYPAEGF